MATINFLIVEAEKTYNNTHSIESGDLIINSTIESVESINRVAKVLEAPKGTILKEGDLVVIHHNILRSKNSVKGIKVNSDFHIEGNTYFVPLNEVFMYRRGESNWKALDPFVFVKPIPLKESSSLVGVEKSHKGMEYHRGVVSFINDGLTKQGLSVGDKVIFKDYSEYEFEIGGEIHYKMKTRDILVKL